MEPITSNQDAAFIFVYNQSCSTVYSGALPDNPLFIEKWHQMYCSDYANLNLSDVSKYILFTDSPVEVAHKCRNGHFTCSMSDTCVIQNVVCDGINDCHMEKMSRCVRNPVPEYLMNIRLYVTSLLHNVGLFWYISFPMHQ